MEKQLIEKSIEITSSPEKIWNVLTDEKLTSIWYSEFSEGTRAETDWKAGSKVTFVDNSQSGLIGRVAVSRPGEELSVEYIGVLNDGIEDYDSEGAISMKGVMETYNLTRTGDQVRLDISCDMGAEYFDMMSASWDKALEKIKELAENK